MNISEMKVNTFWKGEVGVKGSCKDQGHTYEVSLYIKGSQLRDYSCSCAEGNSYKGPCSHANALYQAYQAGGSGLNARPVYTDQEVRTMIREYTNGEVARIIREGEASSLRIAPILLIGHRGKDVRLEFKIGRERLYLIKDLDAFTQAMEAGALMSYGKNLSFHHSLEAFTESSRPMAEFVMELVNTYQEYYSQFRKTSFEVRPSLRELTLSRENRDRFFAMCLDYPVETRVQNGPVSPYLVSRLNPDFRIEIKKKGLDGLEACLLEYEFSFMGERHLYLGSQGKICRCDEACSRAMRVFVEQIAARPGQSITVNDRDVPLFYQRVLKKIETYSLIETQDIDWEKYQTEPLRASFRFDSQRPGEITMEPVLSYGDYSFQPVEDELVPRRISRDIPGEFRISQAITRYFRYKEPEGRKLVIRDDEDALYRLILEGIEEFRQLGEVVLSEEVGQWRIRKAEGLRVGVSAAKGWLNLQVDAEGMTGAELAKVLNAYRQKKKYYRLKSGEFLQLESSGILAVAKLADDLALTKSEIAGGQVRLPYYRALYLDQLFKEEPGVPFCRDQDFRALVRGIKSVEDADYQIPKSLDPVLRNYQKYGFRWLRTLDARRFGGILADDMGLGKTIQVIGLFADEYGRQEAEDKALLSLVVCPASLVYNWEHEFQKFAPQLPVCTIAGAAKDREQILEDAAEELERGGRRILITSYDLLRRDIALYEKLSFRFQIIDEAQFIKNAGTQNARAVKKVSAITRFALTGTPIENRLGELWSIFDYLMPGFLFSYQRFKRDFEIPIVKEQDPEALKSLKRLTGPFILRRVKRDVLKDLPEKLETCVYSRMESQQKMLYAANAQILKDMLSEEGEEDPSGRFQILAQLTKLRQICCDPRLCYENYRGDSAKLETCMELLESGAMGGHKILLFSQFTSMLSLIESRLKDRGMGYYKLTGETPKKDRLHMVDSFQKDATQVFLISLKAGGTGLNLTAADMVIHYDPWWNVAAQNQATDRAHRIGQEKQLHVYRLITRNTIEENILTLQEAKSRLAGQVVDEQQPSLASLSKKGLRLLLGME
ncbi:MAG: DEAD/DEAH box helicase family protein [Lachnospiraceae bacterium]|nr:DEAD/DEAH box helicase family protein [Lachnospiraceae bacterium]